MTELRDEHKRALVDALRKEGRCAKQEMSPHAGLCLTAADRLEEAYREIEGLEVDHEKAWRDHTDLVEAEKRLAAPDTWTPISECGELEPGWYLMSDCGVVDEILWDGKSWRANRHERGGPYLTTTPQHLRTRNGVPVRIDDKPRGEG